MAKLKPPTNTRKCYHVEVDVSRWSDKKKAWVFNNPPKVRVIEMTAYIGEKRTYVGHAGATSLEGLHYRSGGKELAWTPEEALKRYITSANNDALELQRQANELFTGADAAQAKLDDRRARGIKEAARPGTQTAE